MNTQTPVSHEPLKVADVVNLQAAYRQLGELLNQSVVTSNRDADVKGITEYLKNTFLAHADEFIGCWITLNREYQPLLMGVRGLLNRIADIDAAEQANIEAHRKSQVQEAVANLKTAVADEAGKAEPTPDNVIQFPGK
jgi:hypothetical protein